MNEKNIIGASSKVHLRRLLWVGPLAVLASILGVLIVRVVAVAILQPNPIPLSLVWIIPIISTFVFVTGAVLVFALVSRFAANPIRTYQKIALIVLLLTFVPDIVFVQVHFLNSTWPLTIALMVMHVVVWGICVIMLSKLTLEAK